MTLPTDAQARKDIPLARGLLDYFPDALAAVAELSRIANEQHNPGEPMHWAREKSTDHADCIVRHLIDRGTIDGDGMRHSTKVAWRALAMLQLELEAEAPGPDIIVRGPEHTFNITFSRVPDEEPVTTAYEVEHKCLDCAYDLPPADPSYVQNDLFHRYDNAETVMTHSVEGQPPFEGPHYHDGDGKVKVEV